MEGAMWTKVEEDFLKSSMELTILEICNKLGRTRDAVCKRLSLLGLHRHKPFTRKEDYFIEDNYYLLTWDEMSSALGRAVGSIRRRARSLGLSDSDRNLKIQEKVQGWYSYKEDYFSTPNLENSYWAGFLAADGNVQITHKENGAIRRTLQLALSSKDRQHIEKFCGVLLYTGPIRDYTTKESKYKDKVVRASQMSGIRVNITEDMVVDLKRNFNVVPKKSLILEPPNLIDRSLILSYCVGLLDGDGTLSRTRSRESVFWYISFNGTKKVLEFIKSNLDIWFPHTSPYSKVSCVRPTPYNVFNYKIKGERAIRIADSMLEIDIPRLSRKWEPYMEDRGYEKKI